MKFRKLKRFVGKTGENLIRYLAVDLSSYTDDLFVGLTRMDFNENFDSFQVKVTIPATSELAIPNQKSFLPTKWISVRQEGGGAIIDGDTAWTSETLYLKNTGASSAIVTVIFMR